MKKVIEVRDLSFAYPDGTFALENIILDVFENESLAVIGPNGAGKSTLLLHFNGLLNGQGQCIKILDNVVSKENLAFIRQKVGFVFQDPQDQLFMPTAYEDVAFGPKNLGLGKEEVEKRANYALAELGLSDIKDHSSHHLSLGQQRRLSIATVLAMSPEILVLDEPNANLDHLSRRHLIEFLSNLKATKIIATHDLEMVLELCQRVIILDKGKIVSCGPAKEILSDPAILEPHGLEVPLSLKI